MGLESKTVWIATTREEPPNEGGVALVDEVIVVDCMPAGEYRRRAVGAGRPIRRRIVRGARVGCLEDGGVDRSVAGAGVDSVSARVRGRVTSSCVRSVKRLPSSLRLVPGRVGPGGSSRRPRDGRAGRHLQRVESRVSLGFWLIRPRFSVGDDLRNRSGGRGVGDRPAERPTTCSRSRGSGGRRLFR